MCSGVAFTVIADVPEYIESGRRLSPAITRARSDGLAPQWFIHRRIGNQYSTAAASNARSVGTIDAS
jgi:hypothetical protein